MPRPDEGLIHAWLDGQLPPEDAARIEALAASDPEWAAAVAEARGLVAASSRILSALDHVPADVVPKGAGVRAGQRLPWWTKIAAAVVVVVGGSVVVMQNAPEGRMSALSTKQESAQPTPDTAKEVVQAPVTPPPVPAAASSGAAARVPAAAVAGAADAGAADAGAPTVGAVGTRAAPRLRREAGVPQPTASPAAPERVPHAIVAEERKAMQDVAAAVGEVSAAKSLVAKAAPSAMPITAPSVAPTAPAQTQQAVRQDLTSAQNAVPAQRVAGGVVGQQLVQGEQATRCYRLVPDSAHAGVAVIMRVERAVGDTLHLVPAEPGVSQRAWIVSRDGMAGVLTTSGDLRSAVRVVATPAACPVP